MRFLDKILITLLVFTVSNLYSQSAKQLLKTGKDHLKNKNYEQAIITFDKALEIEPDLVDAFSGRAKGYENLGKLQEAMDDYKKVTTIDSENAPAFFNLGRLLYETGKNQEAVDILHVATDLDKKNMSAYHLKIKALINLKNYNNAILVCDNALAINRKNAANHFYHGIITEKLKDYDIALADFNNAIAYNRNFEEAYVALARVLLKSNKPDEALEICNEAIGKFEKSKDAYVVRSKIYRKKLEYPNAINDLSKVIIMNPNDEGIYYMRGVYYQEYAQHQNAINDFNKVIVLNKNNAMAYYKRAISYEEIANYKASIRNYEAFMAMKKDDKRVEDLVAEAQKRLFELNRESKKPVIVLLDPKIKNEGTVEIPGKSKIYKIKGTIKDHSDIEFLKINGIKVPVVKDEYASGEIETYIFTAEIDLTDKEDLEIAASDVYHNSETLKLKIHWTEVNPPKIHIIAPYLAENGELLIDTEDPNLYIEGRIEDESKIIKIQIDGVTASYALADLNPKFSANLNIANKNKITIKVVDQYNNITNQKFVLNREGAMLSANNPMGKTWVIYIENSKYKSFASLDGPAKDILLMKSAFVKYKIHNSIHKKDMTKKQLDRFFSIELRDLVKKNHVNSLIVWYAGHGKFINETGYWIPIDAKRDDEFSYFNINSLKASMQSYSKYITHTLVITDACESGPSFYLAMRDDIKNRTCGDWKASRFKSSQVFSSAGYELAADNSQFTKTFANSLKYNPDDCIPIENIVLKVTAAVGKNSRQKPKFGKIAGLEDENGTFFFMKKD